MFDDDCACGQLTILFDVASAFSSSTSASPYSEDRRFDELRNTSEIILITCMILSILLTRFTDCFLAFTAIKILVADFKTLFQYDYFRQQIADQLFIIVQLFFTAMAIYAYFVTPNAFGILLTSKRKTSIHIRIFS